MFGCTRWIFELFRMTECFRGEISTSVTSFPVYPLFLKTRKVYPVLSTALYLSILCEIMDDLPVDGLTACASRLIQAGSDPK